MSSSGSAPTRATALDEGWLDRDQMADRSPQWWPVIPRCLGRDESSSRIACGWPNAEVPLLGTGRHSVAGWPSPGIDLEQDRPIAARSTTRFRSGYVARGYCNQAKAVARPPNTRMDAGGQALPRRFATERLSQLVGKLSPHVANRIYQMRLDKRPDLRPILGQVLSDGGHLHSLLRSYGIETSYKEKP